MKRLCSLLMVVIMLAGFAFAESSDPTLDEAIQSSKSTIEAYKDTVYEGFGFQRNSVTAFLEGYLGLPLLYSEFDSLDQRVCAEYLFAPEFAACRTGGSGENMLLYTYATGEVFESATDEEILAYFELLKAYLADNAAAIVLDGVSAGAVDPKVVIDIMTSTGYQRAVYDLITNDCTMIDLS